MGGSLSTYAFKLGIVRFLHFLLETLNMGESELPNTLLVLKYLYVSDNIKIVILTKDEKHLLCVLLVF